MVIANLHLGEIGLGNFSVSFEGQYNCYTISIVTLTLQYMLGGAIL